MMMTRSELDLTRQGLALRTVAHHLPRVRYGAARAQVTLALPRPRVRRVLQGLAADLQVRRAAVDQRHPHPELQVELHERVRRAQGQDDDAGHRRQPDRHRRGRPPPARRTQDQAPGQPGGIPRPRLRAHIPRRRHDALPGLGLDRRSQCAGLLRGAFTPASVCVFRIALTQQTGSSLALARSRKIMSSACQTIARRRGRRTSSPLWPAPSRLSRSRRHSTRSKRASRTRISSKTRAG
jgi:hypothetical protein